MLIYRYTIKLSRDKQWGDVDENGTWTGIVNDMKDKVVVAVHVYFC